jgi:3',5'-cyclic AMP phosphodiesterase CpdA
VSDQPTPVRLAHLSDIHVTARKVRWHLTDWFNKRMSAWLNLRLLGRGQRFRKAELVLAALMQHLYQDPPDCVVFSGDATAMGFEEELLRARELLGIHLPNHLPGLAVPGNHDYCVPNSAAGQFERIFSPWLQGKRIDSATYPFAVPVGHVWLIAVNSATVNRWAWDASGSVTEDQLVRLKLLLQQLDGNGPRILVTHYPVACEMGKWEKKSPRLRNVTDLARAAADGGVGLWLHGHRHHPYRHPLTDWTPFPVVCAGSTTQQGLWSYGEYAITGKHLRGTRRSYDRESGQFQATEHFDLTLR